MDRFVLNVKDYRLEMGTTQVELAEDTGLSRKTVAMLEQSCGCNLNFGTYKHVPAQWKSVFCTTRIRWQKCFFTDIRWLHTCL